MSGKTQNGICQLCKNEAQLQDSHIIPKFVTQWLKETGTGYFRRIDSPNVRLQDGSKQRLLCRECEQRFSRRENHFAAKVFKPILGGVKEVQYEDWFAYFMVSILWRALHRNLEEARSSGYRFLDEMEKAEAEWRKFLLGQGLLTQFDHLHIFITDISVGNPPGVPKFNLYCARACDASCFDLEQRGYVVVKFARFFVVAMLTPYVETDWKKTRIVNGVGTLTIPQEIHDVAFGGWLMERAKFAFEKFDSNISSKQLGVIRNHIRNRMPNLLNSDLFRVASADQTDHERILSKSHKTGRNDKCPCGSGLKFKKCHGRQL